MAQQLENAFGTYTAGTAIAAFRLVALSGTNDRTVITCTSGQKPIGISQESVAANSKISVRHFTDTGTFKLEMGLTAGTRNALIYTGASGVGTPTAAGNAIGRILDTASGTGAVIEFVRTTTSENDIGALATIDDDTGGTTGGTEQFNVVNVAIVDNTGGTDGGTATIADILSSQTGETGASGLLNGSTNGSTNSLVKIPAAGHSAGTAAAVGNNDSVLLTMINEVRADIASIVTAVNNNFAVLATETAGSDSVTENNFAVTADRINAIINAAG